MSTKHALIVDDDAKNISVLVRLLEKEDVSSTHIDDVTELDVTLDNLNQLDIIFLDLEMPTLDGFEVFEKLRTDSHLDAIPIIAYSVHVSELTEAHKLGFDGFIGKPLNSERFPDQLQRIFAGKGVWETL